MEDTLRKQQKTIEEQQKTIEELKEQIRNQVAVEKPKAVVAASDLEKQKPSGITGLFGGSAMSNPNISLVLNTYGYSSNLTKDDLKNRGIPGYTTDGIDRRNGFNLDSAELAITTSPTWRTHRIGAPSSTINRSISSRLKSTP